MVKIEIAKPVRKKIKVLLYGPAGSGKTLAALSFPRVLIVDAESGADMYPGRPGIAQFHRARCKTLADLDEVIDSIKADNGKTWDTLVIDPVTVFFDVAKNIATKNNVKDLGYRERAIVNSHMASLYTKLTNLPVHVVLTAYEAIEYEGDGNNLRKVGVKPDVDKKVRHAVSIVVRMNQDHSGIVEKCRGVVLGENSRLPVVRWADFEPVANLYVEGEQAPEEESEEEAATRANDDMSVREVAEAFYTECIDRGLTKTNILAALGNISRWSDWTTGRIKAKEAIDAYIAAQLDLPPATPKTADASH